MIAPDYCLWALSREFGGSAAPNVRYVVSSSIKLDASNDEFSDRSRLAFFLALLAVDSDGFSTLDDGGPANSKPSHQFEPRGFLKISGRDSYREFGTRLDLDLLHRPSIASDPGIAMMISFEIWRTSYQFLASDDIAGISDEFARRGRILNEAKYARCLKLALDTLEQITPKAERITATPERMAQRSGVIFPVWFGTNRLPRPDASGFTNRRDTRTHCGVCSVFVPRSHKIGSTGSSLLKRVFSRQDDRLRLQELTILEDAQFWQRLSNVFIEAGEPGTAIVFIHGYNVSFEAAALRTAQIGVDLAAQHAMAFFSWPSRASFMGYLADEATIEFSEDAIVDFLSSFVENSKASKIHLVVHSMGNRGALRAIDAIARKASDRTNRPFSQIILAAPDIDSEKFKQLSAACLEMGERTTLYVSEADKAVELSHWLHAYPRAGFSPPTVVLKGVDTVVVTSADLSLLGHGYVAESRGVLQDIYQLIVHAAAPDIRFGLKRIKNELGQVHWLVSK